MYFMFDRRVVRYEDIIRNKDTLITYFTKNTDYFSVVVKTQKPYAQRPPIFHYDQQLRPYITRYIFDKYDWLVDFLGAENHQIMLVCNCCRGSRNELLQMPNIFLPEENVEPEDICFYRNKKLLFATISHEEIAFMVEPSKEDLEFLAQNSIWISSMAR